MCKHSHNNTGIKRRAIVIRRELITIKLIKKITMRTMLINYTGNDLRRQITKACVICVLIKECAEISDQLYEIQAVNLIRNAHGHKSTWFYCVVMDFLSVYKVKQSGVWIIAI